MGFPRRAFFISAFFISAIVLFHWFCSAKPAPNLLLNFSIYFNHEEKTMSFVNTQVESIAIMIFPDGRLDAKNAALYLGLKEKTLSHDAWQWYRP